MVAKAVPGTVFLGRERELELVQRWLERECQLGGQPERVECRQPDAVSKLSLFSRPHHMEGGCFLPPAQHSSNLIQLF